ncbi:IS66 family insertion sequence element accessory protein TnpB [uncultured Sphingomonas sp.]|uniref:IS66 family insertion sequence element accessory protein TnpB n=1 Tax=uncultured Sphingomonas sp. TaxID=158754 RepID=UPI003451D166
MWFDDQGLCLLCKRLERGRFVSPVGMVTLTSAQLLMLLEGCPPAVDRADVYVDADGGATAVLRNFFSLTNL